MIIADANLISDFCIRGSRTAIARAVFAKDRSWAAPKLWQAEFVSTLLKYHKKMTADEVQRALYFARSMMGLLSMRVANLTASRSSARKRAHQALTAGKGSFVLVTSGLFDS